MRDKVKRFISILMTALMLVNLMPVGALADGITSGGYQQATVASTTYGAWVYVYEKLTGTVPGTTEKVPSSIMRKFIYKSGRTQSAQGRETCP